MPQHCTVFVFLLSLGAGLAPSSGLGQQTCGPATLGAPCLQGGPAVLPGTEPALNPGVGNPVHLATGNKHQQEIDLPASRLLAGLEIVRHYNSLDPRHSVLGQGWSLSYDTRLFHVGGRWQVVQADGSRILFTGPGPLPITDRHGTLGAQGALRIWTWPNGQQLHFDEQGLLNHIAFPRGGAIDIERSTQAGPLKGTITRIRNAHGAELLPVYLISGAQAYLAHIDTPVGRFQFKFEPAMPSPAGAPGTPGRLRLERLIRPDGMQRRYLYEPAHQAGNNQHLTGIEIISADERHREHVGAWSYDIYGRAIAVTPGGAHASAGTMSIQYLAQPGRQRSGITVVTGAAGHETRFQTALKGGRHVLERVTGAPCVGCAAPGSHAVYDPQGRLTHVNGTQITRTATGSIRQIQPAMSGWPGLRLDYRPDGRRAAWSSIITGAERIHYDRRRQPVRRVFANGDHWQYRYDAMGRPIQVIQKNSRDTDVTNLVWHKNLLVGIHHPRETESREYDARGRLIHRDIARPLSGAGPALHYAERFQYDDQDRLTRHDLPEGGMLAYRWGRGEQLLAIDWHDPHGGVHQVIAGAADRAGYRHGNQLRLRVAQAQGQAHELTLTDPQRPAPLWTQRLHYDPKGRVRIERHIMPSSGQDESWRYAHDAHARLIGAQAVADPDAGVPAWYAWRHDGSLAAMRSAQGTTKPLIARDASGLPTEFQGRTLRYGANRRLVEVHHNGQELGVYAHNAFGQRIARQSPHGRTAYLYLHNRVVAETRTGHAPVPVAAPISAPDISRRYIYAHHVLVGLIDYAPDTTATLYAVHSDLVGAPRLVTDARRAVRWHAAYSPMGLATRLAGDLTLDVRLPGQIFDQATGWHDNHLRTYLPAAGHYLEPDPLGPVPGNQAFGYANQQPRRHVDPLGLLLFAFDGTRNGPETQSNIWKLSQHYQDGPVYYHAGPGAADWDALTASTAPAIIESQWQSLLGELDEPGVPTGAIPIDIIGYSRGAALARHFGNLINQHLNHGYFSYTDAQRGTITACIDLRFMGLFDTVAQFGVLGSQNSNYDLSIAAAWSWVAHAVALQERRWLFPLTSAAGLQAGNTIEAPFIGAHADIGGGSAVDEAGLAATRGDLSDVALNWMLWQARAASLQFSTAELSSRQVTDPIVHDQRSPLMRTVQNGDRSVDAADGSPLFQYQDDHERLGRTQRQATERLIDRDQNWRRNPTSEVGMVDMNGYAKWLHDELGWHALPV